MPVVLFVLCALCGAGDTPEINSIGELQAELQLLRSLIEQPAGDADRGPTDVWSQRAAAFSTALSGPLSLLIYIFVIRPRRHAREQRELMDAAKAYRTTG